MEAPEDMFGAFSAPPFANPFGPMTAQFSQVTGMGDEMRYDAAYHYHHHPDVMLSDLSGMSLYSEAPQSYLDASSSIPSPLLAFGPPQPLDIWGDAVSPDVQDPCAYGAAHPSPPAEPNLTSPDGLVNLGWLEAQQYQSTGLPTGPTRPQPLRVLSESTASAVSAATTMSPLEIDGILDDYSDLSDATTEKGTKKRRQLESNRRAARKCRQKIKDQERDLETREREAQRLNTQLRAQAAALKDEVLSLKNDILSCSGCDCALIQQYIFNAATQIFKTPA